MKDFAQQYTVNDVDFRYVYRPYDDYDPKKWWSRFDMLENPVKKDAFRAVDPRAVAPRRVGDMNYELFPLQEITLPALGRAIVDTGLVISVPNCKLAVYAKSVDYSLTRKDPAETFRCVAENKRDDPVVIQPGRPFAFLEITRGDWFRHSAAPRSVRLDSPSPPPYNFARLTAPPAGPDRDESLPGASPAPRSA